MRSDENFIKMWNYNFTEVGLFATHTVQTVPRKRLIQFLPRDASAERGDATVSRPSVCPSVCDV